MNRFAKACEMSFCEWEQSIPDIVPPAEYTEKHEKWLGTLFNKMRGGKYHKLTTRAVKILVAAAVISALLLTAFIAPASRDFIVDNFNIFSTYALAAENGNSVASGIEAGYIPEGFTLEGRESYSKSVMVCYTSPDGSVFRIYKSASSVKIDFNTENTNAEKITVDGITYTYCPAASGVNSIIWTKNSYVYHIDGSLSAENLIKIAKNIN